MISSIFTTLYIILIAQGVQAWWHPGGGFGYGYHTSWHPPVPPVPAFGPMSYYHPHPYNDVYNMYSAYRGAQIGAALGSLAANFGGKK
ncbi:hypothetical protein WUBG_13479 [Wuchereria bancrofti]|uniref:Uncharacterized protein n=1 Tax=Wuchereria bancrofti TaxID=6293 RepID=J9AMX0_WUCBA|nr:hypothetical protein WUBG_13479 [Wuchereria bancrofti]